MGDQLKFAPGLRLLAEFPASCRIRLINNGKLAAERSADRMEYEVQGPGVYRVEGWLEPGGEERGWIYSNPIYVRRSTADQGLRSAPAAICSITASSRRKSTGLVRCTTNPAARLCSMSSACRSPKGRFPASVFVSGSYPSAPGRCRRAIRYR